jgi:nucleoside-diphosphate-sugar epimerase
LHTHYLLIYQIHVAYFSKTKINVNWKNKQREFDKLGGNGYANIRKISENLGWRPKITIQEGLLESYKWYKKNIHLYVN